MVLSDNPAQAAPSDASYRVAEGGLDCIALYRAKRFAAALKGLRQSHRVIAASPGRHAVLSGLRRSDRPFALVLGNEETGLPRATLEACEEVVAIPGAGRVQSLNVAATAAILIYAVSFAGAER
jgi:TrmH RNA methyltransferase